MQRRTPRKRQRTPWNKSTAMRFQRPKLRTAIGTGSATLNPTIPTLTLSLKWRAGSASSVKMEVPLP